MDIVPKENRASAVAATVPPSSDSSYVPAFPPSETSPPTESVPASWRIRNVALPAPVAKGIPDGRESVPELWMYDVWPGLPVNPNDRGSRTNVAPSSTSTFML